MAIDYSGRRTVNKNRPKKQSSGLFVFLCLGALATAFAVGVLTGWLLFKTSARKMASQAPPAAGAPQQAPPAPAPGAPPNAGYPPLTFYETLPKGGKSVVIGTGLNPQKPGDAPPKPVSPPAPAQSPTAKPPTSPPTKGAEAKEAAGKGREGAAEGAPAEKEGGARKGGGKGNLCIQVASFPERKEAEEMKAKLAAKGLDVYIVESNVPDKGVRFRVRTGKHLEQAEADELLRRAGKGAIIVAE